MQRDIFVDANLRSDDSFVSRPDAHHHRGEEISCLAQAGVGMTSQFPLDYMHLVLLRVSKRLMNAWFKVVPHKLSKVQRN